MQNLIRGRLARHLANGRQGIAQISGQEFDRHLLFQAEEEARQVMMEFQTDMRNKQQEKRKTEGEKAKKEGEAFLAENKKKEGVKVTPSGLQYKVLTTGSGPKPTTNDTVWDWDLQQDRIWWNDSIRTVFGYTGQEGDAESRHPQGFPESPNRPDECLLTGR